MMTGKTVYFFISSTLLAMLIAVAWYFLQHPEDPVADFKQLGRYLPDTEAILKSDDDSKVYRWQDLQGKWHYSDTPPENAQADIIQRQREFEQEINNLQAPIAAPVRNIEPAQAAARPAENLAPGLLPSPDKVMQLINNVRNLENIAAQREKQIEDATQGVGPAE